MNRITNIATVLCVNPADDSETILVNKSDLAKGRYVPVDDHKAGKTADDLYGPKGETDLQRRARHAILAAKDAGEAAEKAAQAADEAAKTAEDAAAAADRAVEVAQAEAAGATIVETNTETQLDDETDNDGDNATEPAISEQQ